MAAERAVKESPWQAVLDEFFGELVGTTIRRVRPATKGELDDMGWYVSPREVAVVFEVEAPDGHPLLFVLSQDEEGNGPGWGEVAERAA